MLSRVAIDPPQRVDLGEARERRPDRRQRREVGVREPARAGRGPGDRVHLAVAEVERIDQIVGDAARRQLGQNDEIPGAIGIGEPAPDRPAGPDDRGQRALLVGVGGQEIVRRLGDLDADLRLARENAGP